MEIEIQYFYDRKRAVLLDGATVLEIGECHRSYPQEDLINVVVKRANRNMADINSIVERNL